MNINGYKHDLYKSALQCLNNPNSIYYGKEGHLRFLRETARAKSDFMEKEWEEFVKSFYSYVYVRACNLKPVLDAKECNSMLYGDKTKMLHKKDIISLFE